MKKGVCVLASKTVADFISTVYKPKSNGNKYI